METYDYLVDEDINLDDYEFETLSVNSTSNSKPRPDPYRFSTKTINVQLYPILNFQKRIDHIRENILPKYENLVLTDDDLKDIIISRIIRDGLSYEYFFDMLAQRAKSKKISELIPSIIKLKNSRMIDIKKIYEETTITEDLFHFVWLYKHTPRFDVDILEKLRLQLPKSVLKGKDGFRNQVTLRFFSQDKARILNVMIFKNGKLTISGIRDSRDLIYTINLVIEHIKKLGAMNYKDLYVHNISYQSVNTHFDLKFSLDNKSLRNIFLKGIDIVSPIITGINLEMDPKSQADLKVRFNSIPVIDQELEECKHVLNHGKNVYFVQNVLTSDRKGSSVTFFQTGKVNIYGSSSANEVKEIYRIINEIMDKHYHDIVNN